MIDYNLLESMLNEKAKTIIAQIKIDYYSIMSDKIKKVLDDLLTSKKIVQVDRGKCKFDETIIAHGGRALRDGIIHFYPDSRSSWTDEKVIDRCIKILPHEIFHYFIQPDKVRIDKKYRKMAGDYTEGLVEKETRIFCDRHKEIAYRNANYGYEMNFVNAIQGPLGANTYEVIFSESDYLKRIEDFENIYEQQMELKDKTLGILIGKIKSDFPKDRHEEIREEIECAVLQDGNEHRAIEMLKSLKKSKSFDYDDIEK